MTMPTNSTKCKVVVFKNHAIMAVIFIYLKKKMTSCRNKRISISNHHTIPTIIDINSNFNVKLYIIFMLCSVSNIV